MWSVPKSASKIRSAVVAATLVPLLVFALSGCTTNLNQIPPPPPPPKLIDVNSPEWQEKMAREEAAARMEAEKTGQIVTKTFGVMWTIDYGYRLLDTEARSADPSDLSYMVMPYLDGDTARVFGEFLSDANLAKYVGQRIVCECTGVEWKYYGQRQFIVKMAVFYGQ